MSKDKKTVLTYGTFDLFHEGHLNIITKAKEVSCGGKVIVGVTIDSFNKERGKNNVIDSYEIRCKNVLDTGLVDEIIPDISFPQKEFDIKKYNVDIIVMGMDWKDKFDYCKQWGVDVIYLDRTPNISTTLLKTTDMKSYIVKDIDNNIRLFKGNKPYKINGIWTNEQNSLNEIINMGEVINELDICTHFSHLTYNDEPVLFDDKIDMVIMFVDMNDKEWQNRYNNYIKTHEIPIPEINNVEVRSRDYGTLKCLLRSIDIYMPWINNVFLVVQSYSQVPSWIDTNKIKIVLHEEFIPKEYLPTYNTFTIQTHVHRIPGLSEKFIFSDDDSIFCREMKETNFFINGKLVQHIRTLNSDSTNGSSSKYSHYFKKNSTDVVKDFCHVKNDFYYMDDHGVQAMYKSLNAQLYNNIDISKHVSAFRDYNNIFRYSYLVYALFKRKIVHTYDRVAYIDFFKRDINDFRRWLNNNRFKEQLSINDQDLNPEFDKELFYKMIEETLQQLFPSKSKYEI